MKNILITLALTFCLGAGLMSCAALEGFFGEDTVFTTQDQLQEGEEAAIIPWDQLPDALKEKIPEGTALVMAHKDQLVADAAYIPVGGELDGNALGGIIDAGFGIAKTFLPALAAWEGVITLFSQRKRKHYSKAVMAALPFDKNVDLGGAVGSLASALGMAHSSQGTQEVFEEEEAA